MILVYNIEIIRKGRQDAQTVLIIMDFLTSTVLRLIYYMTKKIKPCTQCIERESICCIAFTMTEYVPITTLTLDGGWEVLVEKDLKTLLNFQGRKPKPNRNLTSKKVENFLYARRSFSFWWKVIKL